MLHSRQESRVSSSFYGAVTRWVIIAAIVLGLLVGAWAMRGILLLTLASILLVVLFTMPIRTLERRHVPRGIAIVLSLLLVTAVVMVLGFAVLPTLIDQFSTLTAVIIPQGIEAIVRQWSSGEIYQQYPFLEGITTDDIRNLLDSLSVQIASAIGQLGIQVIPVLGGVLDVIVSVLIIIFLSLYVLVDPKAHERGVVRLFPMGYRYRVEAIIKRLDETLRGWLRATILSMVAVGVGTWVGLALLGIEQAVALGVLAGVLSFIPNFGPVMALVPSLVVGLLQTPNSLLWIVAVIYGISFVQSQILTPVLMQNSIRLPPVLVLLGQVVCGALLGFPGLMLSVPITAIVTVLVQEVYIHDVLGDQTASASEPAPVEQALHLPDGVAPLANSG